MEREVRYCTAKDGVRIAYGVDGEGPAFLKPDVINVHRDASDCMRRNT
ncbi:MAG TPA: hypothetical protein VMR52_14325 [Dehalococcoidia bacterium]|nr:hypothetical protein [Dehalococcoidia bacterium]